LNLTRAHRWLTVLGLAGALAGCGASLPPPPQQPRAYLPNISQIETAIAQSVSARDHITVRVLCPAIVPEIPGETFSCISFTLRPRPRALTFLVTEHGGTYVTYAQTS
jgi:hypothetical protein